MADSVVTGTSWFQRVGVALDEMVNAVFLSGNPHETVSVHAAKSAQSGERWACVLCKVLSKIVEPNHCANQFNDTPTSPGASARSALAFAAVILPTVWLVHTLFGVLRHLISA